MPVDAESLRIAIAGATSLRGKDLKQWIEESGFPAGEVRLLDEAQAAGTLTEAGGEPVVIQSVDESSFERMRFVFFTGSAAFTAKHGPMAVRAGAAVIDLTDGLASFPAAHRWIPQLDAVLAAPAVPDAAGRQASVYLAPSAPAIIASSFSAALSGFSPTRLVILFFQPVSERGAAGVEELAAQTTKLLSFQSIPEEVFDTQVAFNLLDRWGEASVEQLADARAALRREVRGYLAPRVAVPALALIQAPVFYGHAFAAYAEFAASCDPRRFVERLDAAGFSTLQDDESGASNMSVIGEAHPVIGLAERDPNVECGYWFWGAADNLRLATANAVRIAERLLAS